MLDVVAMDHGQAFGDLFPDYPACEIGEGFTGWEMNEEATDGFEEDVVVEDVTDEESSNSIEEEEADGIPYIPRILDETTIITSDIECHPKYWKFGDLEEYVFQVTNNESDPEANVTYLGSTVVGRMIPAHMNFETGVFDYGSWFNAFFIRNLRVVMLNQDGTEAYQLDPNDYSKKMDGTPSDYNDPTYPGNVMVAFPKVYIRVFDNGDGSANIHIANQKISDKYQCYAHTDANGNELDYCYIATYDGSVINGVLRSLSGFGPQVATTVAQEVTAATANNHLDNSAIEVMCNGDQWYTGVISDRFMIQLLLILMARTTDTYRAYGYGNTEGRVLNANGNNANDVGVLITGTLDTKGLFWGSDDRISGVKVFGIEHFWGNIAKRIAGWICVNGVQKFKMTSGQQDGSTVNGYNDSGDGYVTIPDSTITPSTGYISAMIFDPRGLIPKELSGSNTTYYTDMIYFSTSGIGYAAVGGFSNSTTQAGACYAYLANAPTYNKSQWFGASLSYKGLAAPDETVETGEAEAS